MSEPKVAYISDVTGHHVSIDMPRHPPRLSVALLWAKPGENAKWQTTLDRQLAGVDNDPDRQKLRVNLDKAGAFDTELDRLLLHVVERLENGLEEAWMSRFGYDAPSWPKRGNETQAEYSQRLADAIDQARGLRDLYDQPEEQWARAFSEMFAYAAYAGIGQLLLGSWTHDGDVYKQWPKVFATPVACQHLSSYGALSRGFPASDLGNGMTAGPNGGLKLFTSPTVEGDPKRAKWIDDKLDDYHNQDLRPGDIASGNANVEQKGFAHCASVLRRWPLGKAEAAAGSASRLQMFDTGVLAGGGDTYTQDHDWSSGLAGHFSKAPVDRRGLGHLPSPKDLAGAVTEMKKALPMGFARLVLLEKGGKARYVSALLPAWLGDHRFTIPRYIWSIRDLPVQGGLVAYWALYAPIGATLLPEFLTESASPTRTGSEIMAAAKAAKGPDPRVRLVAVCTSEPRVVREILKTDDAWRVIAPNDKSQHATYGSASETPGPALTKLDPFTGKLALALNEGQTGEGAWSALASEDTFAQEKTRADTSAKKLDNLPMAKRGVRYFNGRRT